MPARLAWEPPFAVAAAPAAGSLGCVRRNLPDWGCVRRYEPHPVSFQADLVGGEGNYEPARRSASSPPSARLSIAPLRLRCLADRFRPAVCLSGWLSAARRLVCAGRAMHVTDRMLPAPPTGPTPLPALHLPLIVSRTHFPDIWPPFRCMYVRRVLVSAAAVPLLRSPSAAAATALLRFRPRLSVPSPRLPSGCVRLPSAES